MHDQNAEKQRILQHITSSFEYIPDGPDDDPGLREWFIWQIKTFLSEVGPDDLTLAEAVGLVALLGPAFGRLRGGGPPERFALRAV